nr:unnamed protein product [Haemonchus contortus]
MFIQAIVHLFILTLLGSGRLVMHLGLTFAITEEVPMSLAGIYNTTIQIVLAWYPVAIGFIIKWSISGFLSSKTSSSDVRAVMVAERIRH